MQSITNYYNILNQHMLNDKMLHDTKQSNSNDERGPQTVIGGENTCSHVQIGEEGNSPNIKNLQALTINYNSNQNY